MGGVDDLDVPRVLAGAFCRVDDSADSLNPQLSPHLTLGARVQTGSYLLPQFHPQPHSWSPKLCAPSSPVPPFLLDIARPVHTQIRLLVPVPADPRTATAGTGIARLALLLSGVSHAVSFALRAVLIANASLSGPGHTFAPSPPATVLACAAIAAVLWP